MNRKPGLSVRLKLTFSYVALLLLAGSIFLGVVWVFLLRYIPAEAARIEGDYSSFFIPGRNDLWQAFAPKAALGMIALLLFSLVGGWILSGSVLSPLRRIQGATSLVAKGQLSHRINLHGRNDEFRELADSFDIMLAQVEEHMAEQQRFAANASHELRTPLAITRSLLDVARQNPNRDVDQLIDKLYAVNQRETALVQALLILSKADQKAFTLEEVDLSLLAEEVAEMLLPFAEERGITIEVAGHIALTRGSYTLLEQMATNLIHNGIVHNLSQEGKVWVTTETYEDMAIIKVQNTGANLDLNLISGLTEPFRRGTGRIRADDSGVGLGLAIVKSVVQAHDGGLSLSPGKNGGLVATVQIPTKTNGG